MSCLQVLLAVIFPPLAYQALPTEAVSRPTPLGYRQAGTGQMRFSFDDSRYDRNLLDALWLTDMVTGQTVNLLLEDYTFMPEAAQDDSRFYLSCERRKVVEVTTDVEQTNLQHTVIRIYDMFGREMQGNGGLGSRFHSPLVRAAEHVHECCDEENERAVDGCRVINGADRVIGWRGPWAGASRTFLHGHAAGCVAIRRTIRRCCLEVKRRIRLIAQHSYGLLTAAR